MQRTTRPALSLVAVVLIACSDGESGFAAGAPRPGPADDAVAGQGFDLLDSAPQSNDSAQPFGDATATIPVDLRSTSRTAVDLSAAGDSLEISAVGGLAVADLDGDDALDIVVTDRDAAVLLLVGDGAGGFAAATGRGLPLAGPRWSGVAAVDIDGDADLDLHFYGVSDRIFTNDGRGYFADATPTGFDGPEGFTINVSWADPDRDGDLDAYMANNGVGVEEGGEATSDRDHFFVQTAPGTWEDHIDVLIDPQADGFGFVGGWFDADLDGWQDFYLVQTSDNDRIDAAFQPPNHFAWNTGGSEGGGHYEKGPDEGLDVHMFGMGLAVGDYDADGDFDVYASDAGAAFLARNDGEHGFVDASIEVNGFIGPETAEMGWATHFVDVDNDGTLELYTAFGAQPNKIGGAANDTENHALQPDMLWRRDPQDGRWSEVAHLWGVGDPGMNRTAVFADLDRDGNLDLVSWQLVQGLRILMNGGGGGAWLSVEPRMKEGLNRFALGARVEAWRRDELLAMRLVDCGSTGLSSSGPPVAHLGLGTVEEVDIRILWPDGEETWSYNVPTRNRIRVER